ncbi:MAG: hypothetical protein ABIO67_08230 [Mycobacteriales bacterium]
MSEIFRVLHVCTGNICRSPMAEIVMRAGLTRSLSAEGSPFVVESAGTWGRAGTPMEPYGLTTLASLGLDGSAHGARLLLAEQVAQADLILGATREHRAAAVVLQPRASARTFTLREFARLCAGVDPAGLPTGDRVERARAVVRAAAAQRGLTPPQDPRDDDLEDPYRAPEQAYTACGRLVVSSLERPLALLCG